MTSIKLNNPQGGNDTPLPNGIGTGQFERNAQFTPTAKSGFASSETEIEKYERHLREGLIAAGAAISLSVAEVMGFIIVHGASGSFFGHLLKDLIVLGLPTAWLYQRKSTKAANLLVGIAILNICAPFLFWSMGVPYTTILPVFVYVLFAIMFIRARTAAVKLNSIRKAEGHA